MNNILELSKTLENLPDDALQQELQNPSGSVPSYLVVTEINRRNRLRQGAQLDTGAPPPVAEQLTNKIAQQVPYQNTQGAGFAAPVKRMAEGGIARYAEGGFTESEKRMYTALGGGYATTPTPENVRAFLRQMSMADPKRYQQVARDVAGPPRTPIMKSPPNVSIATAPARADEQPQQSAQVVPTPALTTTNVGISTVSKGGDFSPMSASRVEELTPEQYMAQIQAMADKAQTPEQKAAREKDLESAKWNAVLQGGLAMMQAGAEPGTNTLAAISKGAQAGIGSYGAEKDKLEAKDEKARAERMMLGVKGVETQRTAQAKNAEFKQEAARANMLGKLESTRISLTENANVAQKDKDIMTAQAESLKNLKDRKAAIVAQMNAGLTQDPAAAKEELRALDAEEKTRLAEYNRLVGQFATKYGYSLAPSGGNIRPQL